MKNLIKLSQAYAELYGIDFEDFFILSLWSSSGEISLQAHKSDQLYAKYQALLEKGFEYKSANNMHIFTHLNSKITITLS